MAHARLAEGNQGTLESPLRHRPRARRRRAAAADWRQGHAAHAGRRGLARRRAARVRRAEILSGQPPCRRRSQDIGRDDQGALGLRAGSPAAQGRTRPRPLRRPLMARSSSPCADDHDRLRLPSASSPRRRERGKKESPPARLNRRCRPYEKRSSPPWPALRLTDAHTAAGKSADRSIESAKVVLDTPDLQPMQIEVPFCSAETAARFNPPAASWTLYGAVVRPKSPGRIRLTGPNPCDPVQIEANMLSHPDDMKAAVACVELCREIGNSAPLRPYTRREVSPGNLKGAELEHFIRDEAGTYHHQT